MSPAISGTTGTKVRKGHNTTLPLTLTALVLLAVLGQSCTDSSNWYKGNLHTHSLWSDGDDFPEMIMKWYKEHGYHFVALSDHNTLAEGEKWINVLARFGSTEVFDKYVSATDSGWVVSRRVRDSLRVRLKTFEEYRSLFEEPGEFLILQSEEITDGFQDKRVHVNATNLVELITPKGGHSVVEVMQNNIDAVLAQRDSTGVAMFPHVNHPNYYWSISAEDMLALKGENFFEVYNGHPFVNNHGDHLHPSTDRLWDILLAHRLQANEPLLYGLAVDDAHHYHAMSPRHVNPGRGWIMVKTRELTAGAIVEAMESGNFYASTGVELSEIRLRNDELILAVVPKADVSYTIQFIGTLRGFDTTTFMKADSTGASFTSYSPEIGLILKEVKGSEARYRFTGRELYVRARVVSSKLKENPNRTGELERAWTQPFVRKR